MNGSKRTISRILAFVMLVSAMFTNIIYADADVNDVSLIDSVVSSASAIVDEIVDDDVEDLAEATGDILPENIVTVGESLATGTYCDGQVELVDKDSKLVDDGEWTVSANDGNDTITTPNGTVTYTRFVQGSNNPKSADGKKSYNKQGNPVIPEQGAFIIVTPKVKSTLTMDLKINGKSKNYAFMSVDGEGNAKEIEFVTTGSTEADAQFVRKEYTVEPGLTYYVTGAGSKYGLYGLQLVAAEDENPATTTTEAAPEITTADPTGGDEDEATPTDWNFRAGQEGSLANNEYAVQLQAGTDNTTATVKGLKIDATEGKFDSKRDWAQIDKGTVFEIPVDGPCTVTINTYSVDTGFSFNDGAEVLAGDAKAASYIYNGEKGYVKAVCTTHTGSDYIGSIHVEPVKGSGSSFTFWFDEYMTEQGITAIPAKTKIPVDGGEIEVVGPLDTEYSSAAGTYNGEEHKGYKSSENGGKGDGNANNGVPTKGGAVGFTPSIDGVATIYFFAPSGKTCNIYTQDIAEDGSLTLADTVKAEPPSYTFDAKVGQKYYFDTNSTGNLSFVGFKFLVNEPVTVPVSLTGADLGTANVILTDIDTGKEYAKIAKGQSTVTVLKGHTYAVSSDDSGLEATLVEGGTEITIADENTAINVKLEELADVPVTGTITGMDASAVTSITWTKMSNTSVYVTKTAEEAGIKADGSYGPVMLKPGDYAVTAVTTNGYSTTDHVAVVKEVGAEDEIYFVSPDVVTYETDIEIENASSALKFTGMSKHSAQYGVSGGVGATITVPVKPSQRVTVEGGYDGEFEITGKGTAANSGNSFSAIYTTVDGDDVITITVTKVGNVAEGSKAAYIKSIKVENIPDSIPYSDTVTIADAAATADGNYTYPNFKEAIAAIKNMTDRGDKVVTIDVQKDLREQVKFDISNVKIKGNGHTLDWYYALGGKYYSVGTDGYYNEELAHDKFAKNSASTSFWGGVMIITGSNVSVEDYTIKNTFNYEVTDEEIADGVEFDAAGSANTKWKDSPRTKGTDVHTPTYRERALAVGLVGQNLEFYKCNILSSQDTLGYNGANTSTAYFKECTIGGNTDFICGAGAMIFDKCTLEWFMEGQTDSLGYLVAPREIGAYVFRDCEVVRGEDTHNTDAAVQGYYGRCWGGADSKAYFINTEVNGTIKQAGWFNMNGVEPENATFIESGNTSNGEPFGPTDKGNIKDPATLSHLTDEELAAKVEPMAGDEIIENTLGGWTPEHYDAAVTGDNTITTNEIGDFEWWLDDAAKPNADGVLEVAAGEYQAGDSVLKLVPGKAGENYIAELEGLERAGKKDLHGFKAGSRPDNANTLPTIPTAGTSIVFTPAKDGVFLAYLEASNLVRAFKYDADGNNAGTVAEVMTPPVLSFPVEAGVTYAVCTSQSTNNCRYIGFKYLVDVPKSVTFTWENDGSTAIDYTGVSLVLTDTATGEVKKIPYGTSEPQTLMNAREYALSTDNVAAQALTDGKAAITVNGDGTFNIKMSYIEDTNLSGSILTVNGADPSTVSAIKFTNMNFDYSVDATYDPATGKYTVSIKPGEYNTSITTSNGWITKDRVSVKAGAENTNDIYVEPETVTVDPVPFTDTITVPSEQYPTLKSAVTAIKAMTDRPVGEEGRVTINLVADVEEQIVFDAPNITLKSDNGSTISWYYGTNGQYYSMTPDAEQLYSESLFYDRYEMTTANATKWGRVAIIKGDGFIAEGVTFKNTYNYNVTEKELADGAANLNPALNRTSLDQDVTQYKYKERSNAVWLEGDINAEFYQCNILSSQDTLGSNGETNGHAYFKDCVIGGNTDYICGAGTMVFDNCELQWKTYKPDDYVDEDNNATVNNAKVGFLVAPKSKPYIFRNCEVTVDGNAAADATVTGFYGRTWGENSTAYFTNTQTNGHILAEGWDQMSGSGGPSSKFYEYNNLSGADPFVTNGAWSKELTDEATITSLTTDELLETYLNNWVPVHYERTSAAEKGWGDVDADGDVDSVDVSKTLQYTLSGLANINGKFYPARAEVTGEGDIDSADVAAILQKVLNSKYLLPVEKAGDPVPPAVDNPAVIYVLGDSTACHYINTKDDPAYDPATMTKVNDEANFYQRVGFGDGLRDYFDETTTIHNLALSGRSSKSFHTGINENGGTDASAIANYQAYLDGIKADGADPSKDTFAIIAWGHNDEKDDLNDARDTSPAKTPGDYTEEGSFENSLYTYYIKPALDAGVTPIVCTSTVRRRGADSEWSNNDLHITSRGDYPAAARALVARLQDEGQNVQLIDNLENTKTEYEKLTVGTPAKADKDTQTPATGTALLHAAGSSGTPDNTHLNAYGASYVASMMARDIKANAALSALASHVTKTTPPASSEGHAMSFNPLWVPFDQSVYIPSTIWHQTGEWDVAAFGEGTEADAITEDSHPNFEYTEIVPDKEISLEAKNNKGKIQGSSDGFFMFFKQVDANQNFKLTAKATIDRYDAASQTGFGLICRDNVFTGSRFSTATDYVAVGCTPQAINSIVTPLVAISRHDSSLKRDYPVHAEGAIPKTGDVVNLEMTRENGVYTLKYGDLDPIVVPAGTVDTNLVNADKDFVGVYVTRNAKVTYSDINLEILP